MSTLRLVIAWLVMAALPLQGMAAASMLFCDRAAHSTVAMPAAHDHAAHDHAAHGHGDSASHLPDDGAGDVAQAGEHGADTSQGVGLADDGHACPICASCCNLVAISEMPTLSFAGDLPAAQPLQGPARVITRHAPTPDKPPRA